MMRNFIVAILLVLTGFLAGCNNNNVEQEEMTQPVSISLSKDLLEFDSNEDYQTVNVTASSEWTVSGGASWCDVSPDEEKGNKMVTITVKSNETSEDRTTEIIFHCGDATAKLSVVQYGKFDTDYVDMKLEEDGVTTEYDAQTGQVVIEYDGMNPPAIKEGKSIVLPAEYGHGIRVINNVKLSGNTVILGTEQGSMANLFRNMEFTLTTNPDLLSKSRSTGRVVTPISVEFVDETGNSELYSRAEIYGEMSKKVFSFHKNFSGQTLYKGSLGSIEWNGLNINAGLNMVMSFVWGEVDLNKLKLGELTSFDLSLKGDLDVSMILAYLLNKEAKLGEKEKLVKKGIVKVNFRFMVGPVPVLVTIDVDMLGDYYVSSTGNISMTVGGDFQASGEIGMAWSKNSGVSAVKNFTPTYHFYKPGFTVNGSLEAKASLYPKLNFTIYNMLGPWFSLNPYAEAMLAGKYDEEMGETPKFGWSFESNIGMDGKMGLEMEFASINTNIWMSGEYPFFKTCLYKAPTKIEIDPAFEDVDMEVGEEMEVMFNVSGKNLIADEDVPCPIAVVELETEGELGGNLERPIAVSDEKGVVKVLWTPKDEKHKLEAKVLDKDNNIITEAIFPERKNTEREALRLLYESTCGENWKDTTNWLTPVHISEWYGVTDYSEVSSERMNHISKNSIFPFFYTGSEELVDSISLNNNNLTGDAIVSGFSFLAALELGHNNLNSLTIKDCVASWLLSLRVAYDNLKLKELNLSKIYFSIPEEGVGLLSIIGDEYKVESPIYIDKVNISNIKQNNVQLGGAYLISDEINVSDCSLDYVQFTKGIISDEFNVSDCSIQLLNMVKMDIKSLNVQKNEGSFVLSNSSVEFIDVSDCGGFSLTELSSCDKVVAQRVGSVQVGGSVKSIDVSDCEFTSLIGLSSCDKVVAQRVGSVHVGGSVKSIDVSDCGDFSLASSSSCDKVVVQRIQGDVIVRGSVDKVTIDTCGSCGVAGNVSQLVVSNVNSLSWSSNTFIPSVTIQNCTIRDVYIANMTASSVTIDEYIDEVLKNRKKD